MDRNDANMNSISSTWSHLPFGGDIWLHASRCPFVKAHIILPQWIEKKIWDVSHPQQGNGTQVWLVRCCQRSFLSVSRGSVQPHPSSSPHASHPLQLMWPLCTQWYHRWHKTKRTSGAILLINIFVLVPALSKLILSGSAHALQSLWS